MPTLKKFPWVSLTLLLVTYIILGWLLSAFHGPWFVWVTVAVGVFLLAAWLSSPWSEIRGFLAPLFRTDTRAFVIATVFAFLSVVIVTWVNIFFHILVVLSAGTLVKLDSQTCGLSPRQTFWIMGSVSLAGLGLGWVVQTFILRQL